MAGAHESHSAGECRQADQPHAPRELPLFIATIAVCFYIGYFGAGAKLFSSLTLLSLFGFQDLHDINSHESRGQHRRQRHGIHHLYCGGPGGVGVTACWP